MKIKCLALFIAWMVMATTAKTQSVDCSSFCVENIWMDSLEEGILYVTIHFEGDSNDFINYPFVSEIVDINGNSVATGTLNFFGQIGNTSQDYPMSTDLDSIPEKFSAIVYFSFDTVYCILPYPCMTSPVLNHPDASMIRIYPNPVISEINIKSDIYLEAATVKIFNADGRLVEASMGHTGELVNIRADKLIKGFYYVQVQDRKHMIGTFKILVSGSG